MKKRRRMNDLKKMSVNEKENKYKNWKHPFCEFHFNFFFAFFLQILSKHLENYLSYHKSYKKSVLWSNFVSNDTAINSNLYLIDEYKKKKKFFFSLSEWDSKRA